MIIKERKLKTSELLKLCRDKFLVSSYLTDEQLDKDFPIPKVLTEREFADNVEPDPETMGKSANKADPEMKGMTLRERIIAELEYFEKTGKHLDIKNITLCSGSRSSDGDVPDADWYRDDEFRVAWSNPDYSSSDLGMRSAVSLNTLTSNPSETSGIYGLNERVTKLESKVEKLLKVIKI